jgi:hypothetical protein
MAGGAPMPHPMPPLLLPWSLKNTGSQPAVLRHRFSSPMEPQAPGRHSQVGQPCASARKPNGQAAKHAMASHTGPPLLEVLPPDEEEEVLLHWQVGQPSAPAWKPLSQ